VQLVDERSYSEETGMAWTARVVVAGGLAEFTRKAKSTMVSVEDARRVAKATGVELVEVRGGRGCIGALAAIGAHRDPDAAVLLEEVGGG
jgi:tRNA(Ile2) C34 agmatinyltransferase TiaS